MPQHSRNTRRSRLQPAGRRWGFGADTVVPYLASLQASGRPAEEQPQEEQFIRNPVFLHMEQTLRALRRRH